MTETAPSNGPTPGWYNDPATGASRWWDGRTWGPLAPEAQAPRPQFVLPYVAPFSRSIAYVLLVFLGLFGAHRFYLRRPYTAAALLVLGLPGLIGWIVISLSGDVGLWPFMWLVWLVWCVFDLFLIPGYVRDLNDAARTRYVEEARRV